MGVVLLKSDSTVLGISVSIGLYFAVMYQSMCKFWWGEGSGEENGFHICRRIEDLEVVKG